MAINKRIMDKIRERAKDDERILYFLRDLVIFEAEGSGGRYTKEYEDLLRKHALKEDGK